MQTVMNRLNRSGYAGFESVMSFTKSIAMGVIPIGKLDVISGYYERRLFISPGLRLVA